MDDVPELISSVREHYLDHFRAFIAGMRERWPTGSPEMIFKVTEPEELFRKLHRLDFVAKDEDELVVREMQPDKILTFDPFSYELRGVPVLVEHLVWDNVELHHDAENLPARGLSQWFDYWFDPEDARFEPNAKIGRFIHSLFVRTGYLNADFGTATVDAFWDLVDLLISSGATCVRVSSSREAAKR
jgi:hypothetical protein